MTAKLPLALLFAGLSCSCEIADFYDGDQKYVLYDSSVPPAVGTERREAMADDPLATEVLPGAAAPAVLDDNLQRVFQLEAVIDELNRAGPDGAAERDLLLRKVEALQGEVQWRKARAGERYAAARDLRLDRLLAMPVQATAAGDAPADASPAGEAAGDGR